MFEEKVGINYTIFKKYLLELKGPKTDNGKNNKTKAQGGQTHCQGHTGRALSLLRVLVVPRLASLPHPSFSPAGGPQISPGSPPPLTGVSV